MEESIVKKTFELFNFLQYALSEYYQISPKVLLKYSNDCAIIEISNHDSEKLKFLREFWIDNEDRIYVRFNGDELAVDYDYFCRNERFLIEGLYFVIKNVESLDNQIEKIHEEYLERFK